MEEKIKELETNLDKLQIKYDALLSRVGHQSKLIEMIERQMGALESKSKYLDMQFETMIKGRNSLGI